MVLGETPSKNIVRGECVRHFRCKELNERFDHMHQAKPKQHIANIVLSVAEGQGYRA